MWRARFFEFLPKMFDEHPKARWVLKDFVVEYLSNLVFKLSLISLCVILSLGWGQNKVVVVVIPIIGYLLIPQIMKIIRFIY